MSDINNAVIAQTCEWIQEVVIGLNLCPFASRVFRNKDIRYLVEDTADTAHCLSVLAQELDDLIRGGRPEATTLMILSTGFSDFDQYLDLFAIGEALLDDLGVSETVQLASFHPAYEFSGNEPSDPANYTNRSPYPMLHLLQQRSVTNALVNIADPEGIPVRNIACLRSLSTADFQQQVLEYAHPQRDA
ncbi:MAG: DUF1415 domain-containing protein [Gammaproteobacteria bacterium]|nr:DUF1415 domain-containing protein [Gammaproteobacteria bacterium]